MVSTFDLAKGNWQLPVALEAQELIVFTTPLGLYQFTVMPLVYLQPSSI